MGKTRRTGTCPKALEGPTLQLGQVGGKTPEEKGRHTMKRAAIYARVSTSNGQNPEMQLNELREYCQRRGWRIESEYVDNGVSGAKERRPALDRLLQACRKRLVD